MTTFGLRIALLFVSVCAVPSFAHALTLSAEPGPDCFSSNPDKCIGGEYTVVVASVDENTWLATYTMDLALGLEIDATLVNQIEIGVAGNTSNVVVTSFSGPSGAANWVPTKGPLAADGCKGSNGNANFICLNATNPVAIPAGTYVWQIQFDAAKLQPESDWHIGARYSSATHSKGWILSASQAPIPEPGSLALYLIGGALAAAVIRKQVLAAR